MLEANEKPKVYSYAMTSDLGFAPNPSGGICTLACCKQKIRESVGLYWGKRNKESRVFVVGLAGKPLAQKGVDLGSVVYMMEVTGVTTYEDYWNNEKYAKKKVPDDRQGYFTKHASRKEAEKQKCYFTPDQCGDNVYSITEQGDIIAYPSFHYFGGESMRVHELVRERLEKALPSLGKPHSAEEISDMFGCLDVLGDAFVPMKRDIRCQNVLVSNSFVYFGKSANLPSKIELPNYDSSWITPDKLHANFSNPRCRINYKSPNDGDLVRVADYIGKVLEHYSEQPLQGAPIDSDGRDAAWWKTD